MQNRMRSEAALRWGMGVKAIAVAWLGLLFSAWLHGEIAAGLIYGSVASGVLWTMGSFLQSASRDGDRYRRSEADR